MGCSIPLVLFNTTLLLSTGAMAISVALRMPYCFIRSRNGSQSMLGVKSVSSLTPAARRSQGNTPCP